MKFKAFINEDVILDKDAVVDYVKKNCKEYLSYMNYDKAFRINALVSGKRRKPSIFIHTVRKNRRPLDSDIDFHETMDNFFFKNFGIRGRSGCIFASKTRSNASDYGIPYYIFPTDGYKLLYNNNVVDLWDVMDHSIVLYKDSKFTVKMPNWDLFKEDINDCFIHPSLKVLPKGIQDKILIKLNELRKTYVDLIKNDYKITKDPKDIKEYAEIMVDAKEVVYIEKYDDITSIVK